MTFQQIYEAVARLTGDISSAATDKCKDVVNLCYLNEVLVCDELYPTMFFLIDPIDDIYTKAAIDITGITAANPPVVSCAGHKYVVGDIVSIGNVSGMTEVNNRTFLVGAIVAGTSVSLYKLDGTAVDGSTYTAWTAGGQVRHRGVTTPNIERILNANWHGYNKGLHPIGTTELEESTGWWDYGTTTRPTRYMLKKYYSTAGAQVDRLLWFPLPNAIYQMRTWTEKVVSAMSNDGDVPVLPPRFHNMLVSGAVATLEKYGEIQVENAVIWPRRYMQQMDALKLMNRKWWKQFEQDERSGLYLA